MNKEIFFLCDSHKKLIQTSNFHLVIFIAAEFLEELIIIIRIGKTTWKTCVNLNLKTCLNSR